MSVVLIRHGTTQGNREHRYIGCRTDEPLCAEGIAALRGLVCPPVRRVYVSPMTRCLQTAAILYPNLPPEVVPDFRECDFGDFEGLGYAELNGRAEYQAWVDSGGELSFPHGESKAMFSARCVRAYERLASHEDCALIVHGGTIMAIMERYARPKADYYHFQVRNGEGYLLSPSGAYARLISAEKLENGIDAMPRNGYNVLDK